MWWYYHHTSCVSQKLSKQSDLSARSSSHTRYQFSQRIYHVALPETVTLITCPYVHPIALSPGFNKGEEFMTRAGIADRDIGAGQAEELCLADAMYGWFAHVVSYRLG